MTPKTGSGLVPIFFGLLLLGYVIFAFFSGSVSAKIGRFERDSSPVLFWIVLLIQAGLAVAFFGWGIKIIFF